MSESDIDKDVPDDVYDDADSTWEVVLWGLVMVFGLAMFAYEFGSVILANVPRAYPIAYILNLEQTLFSIALVGGGLFTAAIIYAAVRYAAPFKSQPDIMERGAGKYAVALWAIGISILVVMTIFMGAATLAKADADTTPRQFQTDRTIHMTVVGAQWYWRMDVEGVPGTQGEAVVLPSNTVVKARVTSPDVIHSFAIQELGVKKDAVPGQWNQFWFMAKDVEGETTLTFTTRNGTEVTVPADVYQINCAELCGKGHSTMVGKVYMISPSAYRKWVRAKGGHVPDSFTPNASESMSPNPIQPTEPTREVSANV